MCELKIGDVGRASTLCDRYDVVDTRRERVRKFQLEVNSLPADTADRLRRVYLFLVAVELRPLRSVMVGADVGLCHYHHLAAGLETVSQREASIADGIPLPLERENPSPFLFKLNAEDIVKVENTYPRAVLLDDNSVSDKAVIVPLVFFVGLSVNNLIFD